MRSAATILVLCLATPGAAQEDPWSLLSAARDRLAAAPFLADFEQTFVAAGFTGGDTETGTVALALPDLLRWDYREPYPRTFLVHGRTVFTWNEGERSGRRFSLESEEVRHLDLLRLDVEQLRGRYQASVVAADATSVEIRLQPPAGDEALVEATLTLSRSDLLPAAVTTRDAEGNETRLRLSGYRPLEGPDRFVPPDGIEWLEP